MGGVSSGWIFIDVIGLDEELLALAPQPVLAVYLLFPSKPIRGLRREALAAQVGSRVAPASTFYLIQHKDFGNACGTIAAVHAVGNLVSEGSLNLVSGSPIEKFLNSV